MTVAGTDAPPDHDGGVGRRCSLAVLANVVGAVVAGAGLVRWGLPELRPTAFYLSGSNHVSPQDTGSLIVIAVGLGLAVLPGLLRLGWFLAAAGVIVATVSPGGRWDPDLAAVVAGGLVLAGLLAALRWADGRSRTGMVTALAFAVVAGPGVAALAAGLRRLSGGSPPDVDRILVITMAVVLAMVGLVVAPRRGRPDDVSPVPASPRSESSFAPFAIACLAAAVGSGLHLVSVVVLREFAYTPSGGISPGREGAVDLLDRITHTAIAVIAALILVVYAYRRGGTTLARWVVVGFAMAVPVVAGLPWGLAALVPGWRLAGAAAVGAVLGTGLVALAGRFVAWEAFGAIAVAIGLLVTSARGQREVPEVMPIVVPLFAGAMGFTLAAGLAVLLPGRALRRERLGFKRLGSEASADFTVLPGLGLAAMVLGVHVLGPVVGSDVDTYGDMRITGTAIVVISAIVLLSLFGLGRVVASKQRDDLQDRSDHDASGQMDGLPGDGSPWDGSFGDGSFGDGPPEKRPAPGRPAS